MELHILVASLFIYHHIKLYGLENGSTNLTLLTQITVEHYMHIGMSRQSNVFWYNHHSIFLSHYFDVLYRKTFDSQVNFDLYVCVVIFSLILIKYVVVYFFVMASFTKNKHFWAVCFF